MGYQSTLIKYSRSYKLDISFRLVARLQAWLDFDVTFHALIGEDYYGSIIRGLFAQQEHLAFLGEIDPLGTHRHINLMDNEGARISLYMQPGTFNPNIDWVGSMN